MYPGHVENVDLRHQFQISAITTDIFRSMEWNGVIFWILKRRRRKIHGVDFEYEAPQAEISQDVYENTMKIYEK